MKNTTKNLTTAIVATTLTLTPLATTTLAHAQENTTTQTTTQPQQNPYTTQQATITIAPNSTFVYKHNIHNSDNETQPTVTKMSVKQTKSIDGITLKANATKQNITITTQDIPENAEIGNIEITYTFSDEKTLTVTDTIKVATTKEEADKANTDAATQSQTTNPKTAFTLNPETENTTTTQTETPKTSQPSQSEQTTQNTTQTQTPTKNTTTNKGTTVTNTQTQTRNPKTTTTTKTTTTPKQTFTIPNKTTQNNYETQNPTIHITPNSTNEVKFTIYNTKTKTHPKVTKVSASQKQGAPGFTIKVDAKQQTLKLIADNTLKPQAILGPIEVKFTLEDGTVLTAQALPKLHETGFDTDSENTKENQKATTTNASTAFIINPNSAKSNKPSETFTMPMPNPLEPETQTTPEKSAQNTQHTTTTPKTTHTTQTPPAGKPNTSNQQSPNQQPQPNTKPVVVNKTENKQPQQPQTNTKPVVVNKPENKQPQQSQTQTESILLSNVHTLIKPGESAQVFLYGQGANTAHVTYSVDPATVPTGWEVTITPDASMRVAVPENTTTTVGNIQVTATTPEGETTTSIFTFETQSTIVRGSTTRMLASTGASITGLIALSSIITALGAITILRRKK